MTLASLISNTNRPIIAADSDVRDAQDNILPQELFAAKCTPRGFLVTPKVVRVGPRSDLWTRSGTWADVAVNGIIEDTATRESSTTNDFMEITIRARAFRLLFYGDTNRGIAGIKINGSNPSTLTGVTMEDASAALDSIDLYRAAATNRLFFGYKGLGAGPHTIRITVTGTKNAASTGFLVSNAGIEYVDELTDAAAGVACNQVLVLPYGDREDLVDPGDTALISYVGTWSTVNDVEQLLGRRRESTTAGDYFEITFTGTGIVLFFVGDNSRGFLDVTVDAVLVAKRWTTYFATTTHFNYPFPILGLSSGSHTVRVTVNAANEAGANNTVSLAGFFVVKDTGGAGDYGGVLLSHEKRWNKTGLDTVTLAAPDATNPRKDLLVINKAGTFSFVQGTAAATPTEPAHPTDDKVVLAVITQEKSGILLQRLHAKGMQTENENDTEIPVLIQVQDRRRGIVSALGELPLGTRNSSAALQTQLRLPDRTKAIRVKFIRDATVATRRGGFSLLGAPTATRRYTPGITANNTFSGVLNVEGFGGKVVELYTDNDSDTLLVLSAY